MEEIEHEDVSAIWQAIEADPVEGARLCRQQIENDTLSIHARRRRRIAEGYFIAVQLRRDYAKWKSFVADPFFDDDPRIRNKKEERFEFIVMRAVMMYLWKAKRANKSLYNRMCRYARAMEIYAELNIPVDQVAKKIREDGGVEKLSQEKGKISAEEEAKDWEAEMQYGESVRRGQAAKATVPGDTRYSAEEAGEIEDEDDEEEIEEDEDDGGPRGQAVWAVYVEPEELAYLDNIKPSKCDQQIKVIVSVRYKDDDTHWFEAIEIDYL